MSENNVSEKRDQRLEYDERARAAARTLSAFVNAYGHSTKAFTEQIMTEHRTLQQQMFEVMLSCIKAWAESEHYDLRNEYTVQKCREIMSVLKDGVRVPLI